MGKYKLVLKETMSQESINQNRQVFLNLRPHQVVLIQYGPEFRSLATVLQVQAKAGNGGDTSLLIRFKGQEKLQLLSWKDENLVFIRPLTLEEIEDCILDNNLFYSPPASKNKAVI